MSQRERVHIPEELHPDGPVKLCIGGIGFFLEWPNPGMVGRPLRFYQPFEGEGKETVRLHIRSDDCPDFSRTRCIFDAEQHWQLYRQDSQYIFEIFDTLTKERNTVAFVSDDFHEAELYVFPVSSEESPPPWFLPRLMQPLGQLLLVNLLSRLGGVMVHALGIDDSGRGMVFVGPSGSGKSTLCGLWHRHAGVHILSDECVILRRLGGRLYAYGTPWSGLQLNVTPHPGPVEVQRIFCIGHHREHRVWNEPGGTFASHLFSQLFLPFWDRTAINCALEFCQQLVLATPCQRLGFANDASIVNFLRSPKIGGTR